MNRRKFMQVAGAASAALLLNKQANAEAASEETKNQVGMQDNQHHQQMMNKYAAFTGGDKLVIAMLVYPGMFLQDLVGPLAMFESLMNREIHLVWKDKKPVGNMDPKHPTMIPVAATTTFADCPKNLDVLFVPGGVPGTFAMMEDPEVLSFLKEQGKTAKYITSVCTGSLILGAAGLLKGYKATSHWVTLDVLAELGATPTKARIVEDRNRITGGGVTAGLDFGLLLIARLRNQSYAEAVQLYLEYNPQPPFNAGSVATAPKEVVTFLDEMFAELKQTADSTAMRAAKKI
ncbi:MAG TPA: DJ-1/PfpI family protein [Methylophilus sp.]|nr:DJ-1/PfpI family protein [Methylophilus sp.]HQQ34115.1 DJ-1/PfpI family protein [Methylophilus sp.]